MIGVGHRDVAGEDVVERRDVGRALDAGVAAQGHDAAARPADVAQQRLQDRRRADVLDADGVMGPADGVAERPGALADPSCRTAAPATFGEQLGRDAAGLAHHLRRVPGEVPLEDLVHAARVLQGLVAVCVVAGRGARRARRRSRRSSSPARGRRPTAARRAAGVLPRRRVVRAGLGVEPGEDAAELLGVDVVVIDDGGGIRVGHDVVAEVALVRRARG